LIFEVRGLPSITPYPHAEKLNRTKRGDNFVGNVFYGSEGVLVCPSYDSGVAFTNKGEVIEKFSGGGDHYGNFVQAVRERKPQMLNGPIVEGHISSALCHLGNLSYQLGELQPFSKQSTAFGDDKAAAETLLRMKEHLEDNKMPLDDTKYRVGRKLLIDPKTETFTNDTKANELLTREYRKGFEVPAKL
jgi:hypothetical protein